MTDREGLRERLDELERALSSRGVVCDACGRPVDPAPSVTAEFVDYGCTCDDDRPAVSSSGGT